MKLTDKLILAAVAVGVVYFVFRGVRGVARDASQFAVEAGLGLAEGAVVGIGESFGIPETSQTECERALAEGRYWDASFACPATDFLGGIFGSRAPAEPPPRSQYTDLWGVAP